MTEQEYIDVQNLTVVRIIRAAAVWLTSDPETKKHIKKIYEGIAALTIILNGRIDIGRDELRNEITRLRLDDSVFKKSRERIAREHGVPRLYVGRDKKPDIPVTEEIAEDATKGDE